MSQNVKESTGSGSSKANGPAASSAKTGSAANAAAAAAQAVRDAAGQASGVTGSIDHVVDGLIARQSPAAGVPPLIARERALVADLIAQSAERGRLETEIEKTYQNRKLANETEYLQSTEKLKTRHEAKLAAIDSAFETAKKQTSDWYLNEKIRVQSEYEDVKKTIELAAKQGRDDARKKAESAKWEAEAIHQAAAEDADKKLNDRINFLDDTDSRLEILENDALALLRYFHQEKRLESRTVEPSADLAEGDPFTKYHDVMKKAIEQLSKINALSLPRAVVFGPLWIHPLILLLTFVPAVFVVGWKIALGVAIVVAGVAGTALWFQMKKRVDREIDLLHAPLLQAITDAERLKSICRQAAKAQFDQKTTEAAHKRDSTVAAAEVKLAQTMEQVIQRRIHDLESIEERHRAAKIATEEKRVRDEKTAVETRDQARAAAIAAFETDTAAIKSKYKKQYKEIEAEHDSAWNRMADRWRDLIKRSRDEIEAIRAETNRLFIPWPGADWKSWTSPRETPSVLKIGEIAIDTAQIPEIIPKDKKLEGESLASFTLPAFIPFPTGCNLLIKTDPESRAAAGRMLQSMMLRLMTAVPAGKVRFTILDPVTLGESFATFMHLADIDESLVTQRIWTESDDIDARLVDLTEHMENVIQKYLRNEFPTLEEYNIMAGEVAEPYRFLVVANYPARFGDDATKRICSIAANGPRCGVFVFVSVDMSLKLPHGFDLKELEQFTNPLEWRNPAFYGADPVLANYPIFPDPPPPADEFVDAVQVSGTKAKEAKRVEVPFDVIAPPAHQYWTQSSAQGIDVPLGRAGATKLQSLKLGKGTSQHMLIAGKTGSGKSTLMHALITNSALRYSPAELELYLIDFKKGVEFKTYAAHLLPHARVIAVESEREFGLSVLQRLDAELKKRGDDFRDAGAQDLRAFRQARPDLRTPRILFIVDEFQEFFVEDDRIAQEVSLLLDRLVRQGRAFGIHVLLGSQTLGGSYSLPRSTVGQMAIRIALQCSENDAHLILSEENSAARLLSRPGEAIYNDANGLSEGNHPFQVVWLSDERREVYLKELYNLAVERNLLPVEPQIIFEGNLPADVGKNATLNELLNRDSWPKNQKAFPAWLGEAIAIKEPTSTVFRRMSGVNTLIIGQNEEGARGIVAMSIVELAAQHPIEGIDSAGTASARFYVLDGALEDSPWYGFLAGLKDVVPHRFRAGTPRDVADIINEVGDEFDRRNKEHDLEAPTIYLFIFDLQRFRDLRKQEEDFGYSRRGGDQPPSPSRRFGSILRDGPPLGIHTIVWCDTLNNLNRAFDRQILREFETRILFQMSSSDSSSLIDSPAASRLGPNRAFYHNEEQARLEKFRPYAIPEREWLESVSAKLKARVPKVD
jgi:S-DNA-T family DNA segregation ATPase FtsK/SpoIIIE